MRKNLLKVLWCVYTLWFLFISQTCFAVSYDYPWYFKVNKVEECWNMTKGNNVIIDVIDTMVSFVDGKDKDGNDIPILKNKEYFSKSYMKHPKPSAKELEKFEKELDYAVSQAEKKPDKRHAKKVIDIIKASKIVRDELWLEEIEELFEEGEIWEMLNEVISMRALSYGHKIHGTGMASLIVGDTGKLVCNEDRKSFCDKNGEAVIAGIAPEAAIISREWIREYSIGGDLEKAISDAVDMDEAVAPEDVNGKKQWKKDREVKLILLNISGGIKVSDNGSKLPGIKVTSSGTTRSFWFDKIKRNAKGNPYFLIVAAVGNDGKKLDRKNGFIPAILPAPSKRSKARDPIIRVGAVEEYNSTVVPKLYKGFSSGSNYGRDFVDIMAPGNNIYILTPKSEATPAAGTSESTAIVTGAIALLASCHPSDSADHFKQHLLGYAKKYPELAKEVKNGRVLDIYGAVKNFCFDSPVNIDRGDSGEEGTCFPDDHGW